MRGTNKNTALTIGGAPRVDLLPPEVRAERRAGIGVRRAWMGVIGVVVLVGIGVTAATLHASLAQDSLLTAQGDTQSLLVQQGTYTEVRDTKSLVQQLSAAQAVGGATEIAWPEYLAKIQATLPAGVVVTTITLDQATPLADYAQATSPLQSPRVATLTFTAMSQTLPSVPDWLDGLATLPGYTDANPGSVTLDDDGIYNATVTMHIDQDAFSNRFSLTKDN